MTTLGPQPAAVLGAQDVESRYGVDITTAEVIRHALEHIGLQMQIKINTAALTIANAIKAGHETNPSSTRPTRKATRNTVPMAAANRTTIATPRTSSPAIHNSGLDTA